MDFSLTDEQLEVRNLAAKILGDKVTSQRLREVEAGDDRFDELLWAALAEAGLLGIAVEMRYGGMGFGFETLCLLIEEVGRTVAPVPVIPVLVEAALALQHAGNEALCARWLPGIADGSALLTAAYVEPANDIVERPVTRAAADDDGWRLDGVKQCVVLANRAARILVCASADVGPVVCLLDPKAAGVTLERQQVTAGEPQFRVHLNGVVVAADDVVATGEAAGGLLTWIEQRRRAALCAMAVGLTEKMLRMTAEYTTTREQFGRPIGSFQAVGHRAADCYIDVESLRLVTQQAVALLDAGAPADDAVLIAKLWCGDVTHRVSQAAQHLHGGIGVDRDYPLFRYCLWARQLELTAGTSAALTEDLGRHIAARYSP